MPRSTLYPSLGLDIMNGLKQSLKQQQVFDKIQLLIDNIGYGTDEPGIYAKAEKMLLQEDADLVIVCADSGIAQMLQPLFTATGKILLVLNFGANLPASWQAEPTSLTLSLNFCLHTKLTGRLAALTAGKQVANVVSYFDGGYNQCFSMLNSNRDHGGIPRFNHVTHLKPEAFTLQPLVDFLEENKDVQTLLCLFSGEEAGRFYQGIASIQQKNGLDLFVSPMMVDDTFKKDDALQIQRVQGFVPWHASLQNEANELFKRQVRTGTTRANYFSLLGWEAGLLLANVCLQAAAGQADAAAMVTALTQERYNSPRGWLKIDAGTHHGYGPSWQVSVHDDLEVKIENEAAGMEEEWKTFSREPLPGTEISGWRNTYLCI